MCLVDKNCQLQKPISTYPFKILEFQIKCNFYIPVLYVDYWVLNKSDHDWHNIVITIFFYYYAYEGKGFTADLIKLKGILPLIL